MTALGHSSSTPFPLLSCFYLKRPIIKSFNKTLRCTAEDSERLELKTTNSQQTINIDAVSVVLDVVYKLRVAHSCRAVLVFIHRQRVNKSKTST